MCLSSLERSLRSALSRRRRQYRSPIGLRRSIVRNGSGYSAQSLRASLSRPQGACSVLFTKHQNPIARHCQAKILQEGRFLALTPPRRGTLAIAQRSEYQRKTNAITDILMTIAKLAFTLRKMSREAQHSLLKTAFKLFSVMFTNVRTKRQLREASLPFQLSKGPGGEGEIGKRAAVFARCNYLGDAGEPAAHPLRSPLFRRSRLRNQLAGYGARGRGPSAAILCWVCADSAQRACGSCPAMDLRSPA